MAAREVEVGAFVNALRGLESSPITRDRVAALCAEQPVRVTSLERYLHFLPSAYTRNLIYRDEYFEFMTLCWQPGQRTVIHTHNGQLGWMTVVRGALAVVNYKWLGCNAADNQNVSGLDCLAGATELDLERREVHECHVGGPVAIVDKVQTIHQVVVQGREPAISLHIYSRPMDSCVAFDLKERRCYRRQLVFYSRYGEVLASPAELAVAAVPPPTASATIPADSLRRRNG